MSRYLTHMTATAIANIDKDEGVVILPIGAVEQHGPHLPVLTDTLIATHYVDEAIEALPDDVKAWVLPAQNYGKSNEHINFSGTITLSATTLMAVLHDIANSVARMGFRRLCFVNGHGGNIGLLDTTARDIRVNTGMYVFNIHGGYSQAPFEISADEWKYGFHAGETETSLILHIAPDMVQMDKAIRHIADYPKSDTDLFFFGRASSAWLADDWSPSGVYGDATKGSADKGRQLSEEATANLVKLFTLMSRFEAPGPHSQRMQARSEP